VTDGTAGRGRRPIGRARAPRDRGDLLRWPRRLLCVVSVAKRLRL